MLQLIPLNIYILSLLKCNIMWDNSFQPETLIRLLKHKGSTLHFVQNDKSWNVQENRLFEPWDSWYDEDWAWFKYRSGHCKHVCDGCDDSHYWIITAFRVKKASMTYNLLQRQPTWLINILRITKNMSSVLSQEVTEYLIPNILQIPNLLLNVISMRMLHRGKTLMSK